MLTAFRRCSRRWRPGSLSSHGTSAVVLRVGFPCADWNPSPGSWGSRVNETEVYSHSQRILLLTTLACVLTLLLVVFGGFWFSRQILRPLGRLEDTINRFASGEVGVRAPEEGVDEVGRLKHHFNLMADTIQEQTEALAMRVDTLEGILPICASCRKIRNEEGGLRAHGILYLDPLRGPVHPRALRGLRPEALSGAP